ncbi:MAG: hypothetical protein E7510_06895 [Ruminococcus sp.]|nr:hypothetical protein [Ruminococcus sp.]
MVIHEMGVMVMHEYMQGKGVRYQICPGGAEKMGYLVVSKLMPNQTKSGRIEYVYDFYEYSEKDVPQEEERITV